MREESLSLDFLRAGPGDHGSYTQHMCVCKQIRRLPRNELLRKQWLSSNKT